MICITNVGKYSVFQYTMEVVTVTFDPLSPKETFMSPMLFLREFNIKVGHKRLNYDTIS